MVRIRLKQTVGLARELAHIVWQRTVRSPEPRCSTRGHKVSGFSSVALPARRSARASSISLLNAPWLPANCWSQSSSSRSSARSHSPIRSCSSSGNAANFATAVSNSFVIPFEVYRRARGLRGGFLGFVGAIFSLGLHGSEFFESSLHASADAAFVAAEVGEGFSLLREGFQC